MMNSFIIHFKNKKIHEMQKKIHEMDFRIDVVQTPALLGVLNSPFGCVRLRIGFKTLRAVNISISVM